MTLRPAQPVECLLSAEDIRLLSAVGFMAARSGLVVPAIRLFEALSVLRPQKAFPFVGLAFSQLCIGATDAAEKLLRDRALKIFPDDPELLACLVLAVQASGRAIEARKLIHHLITATPSGEATPLVTWVVQKFSGTGTEKLLHPESESSLATDVQPW